MDTQDYHTSPLLRGVLYFCFWAIILAGITSAILFDLHFLFIITPILCAFGLMLSALLVRGLAFQGEYLVLTYHLAGIRNIQVTKPLDDITEIALYGGSSYSHLRISYKPTPHVQDPYDEIQSRIYCSDPEAPGVDPGFPLDPGPGKRQFVHHLCRLLEARGHRLYVLNEAPSGYTSGRGWAWTITVDQPPEQPRGRDTWMME